MSTVQLDPGPGAAGEPSVGTRTLRQRGERRIATLPRRSVRIRPISAHDGPAYRSILERTTTEDRYCRFFHVVNHFSQTEISRFVEPQADTVAFIAYEGSKPQGVAHLFFLSPTSAELAIVVASDCRRRGIGRALVRRLIAALRRKPCFTVTAYAFMLNRAFTRLALSIGMTPGGTEDGVTTWTLLVAPND